MIQSMTGYAKTEVCFGHRKIHIELKALNSKSFDLNMRISQFYREKEQEIRQLLAQDLYRGKIDISIWIEKEEVEKVAIINHEAVKSYLKQIQEISADLNIPCDLQNIWSVMAALPATTVNIQQNILSEEEWNAVKDGLVLAIQQFIDFRTQEGRSLYDVFLDKLNNISLLSSQLERFESTRVAKIRERLTQRLKDLQDIDYDRNRLEQELIYYIEKLDINEEKTRLANHIRYFKETLDSDSIAKGKKLGFIAQEMGREINTTGSKSNEAEMQNIVVKMKDELEQVKEQVLNVL